MTEPDPGHGATVAPVGPPGPAGRRVPAAGPPGRPPGRLRPVRPPWWPSLPVPLTVTLLVALGLTGLWLVAPPTGTDLSAQVARADFFAAYGFAPIDFRWYGGTPPLGYSLLSPPLMAWFGVRPVGAAAVVVSASALVTLLRRTGARRPVAGGVLGAVCLTGNLVSGRVTFALGVALGLLALLALTRPALEPRAVDAPGTTPPAGGRWPVSRWRLGGAAGLAALAAAASPVAGLFVGLAGTALLLGTVRRPGAPAPDAPPTAGQGRYPAAALLLMTGAAVPMAVLAGWFGTGGWMNISRADTLGAVGASLAVAALVPRRVVRTGALLSAGGVVAAYLLTTPVGLNATRLAALFALPLVAAYAAPPRWRRWGRAAAGWPAPVLLVLALVQPPVEVADLATVGHPTAAREFSAGLRAELARRDPPGRVEVVPTVNYWESAHLAGAPLARGWLRQADLRWHPLFFDGTLDAASYRRWLRDNGVSHVALADTDLSWVGRAEAGLIRRGLPYLTPVWRDEHWTLYQVAATPGLVDGPADVVAAGPDGLTLRATGPGEILTRVRWSRWLAVAGPAGACLAPAGDWTVLRVDRPGRYRISGSLTAADPSC